MIVSEFKEEELAREIAGEYNTFRVYLYMLKVKGSSSREVQRALNLSSPTLAQHHLEKLRKHGLVSKDDDGTYHVISKSFGILKLYIRSGRWIVPRTIFLTFVFAILAGGFVLLIPQHRFFWIASALSLSGLVYSLYETIRFYRVLPKD